MHAYTIAVTLAMAGSSMAAILQNPPSTSTTTTTVDEIRPYGPTCAGIGPEGHGGPTCAGVGPDAHTPSPPAEKNEEEEDDKFVPYTPEDLQDIQDVGSHLDVDHDGDFDHVDMATLRASMNEDYEEPELDEPEHDEPEPEEPEHVKPALPEHVRPPTVRVATRACPECPKCEHDEPEDDEPELDELEVEEPEHDEPELVEPELPKHVEPPTVRVATKACPVCPKCTKCPDPSEHNPNWNQMALLNDTRKNINGFKMFAVLKAPPSEDFPPRFAVHVREHDERKDIWNVKIFPEVMGEITENMEAAGMNLTKMKKKATPSQKAFLDELMAFNSYQPRWNLADNRLETRSNTSAPVNDTLYFRLFEDQPDSKDTSQFHGPVYRSMLTTNSNKNKYNKENNAKLIGKKSWQLKRDGEAPWHYTLINKDMPGNFFWCLDQRKMSAMEEKIKSLESSQQEDGSDALEALQALGDHKGAELMFMNSTSTAVQLDKGKTNCRAVTLKVR
jgi:hypothetical protein